jgi:hypothetical protein
MTQYRVLPTKGRRRYSIYTKTTKNIKKKKFESKCRIHNKCPINNVCQPSWRYTQGGFYCKPRRSDQIESTQISSRDIQMGGGTVHSDQIVLGTVRWVSGTCERQPKPLKTKLTRGELSGLSPLRSDGSHDSQAGCWTMWEAAKDTQGRESENNSRKPRDLFKKWHSDSLKSSTYSFSGQEEGRWSCWWWRWWWCGQNQCVTKPSDCNTVNKGIVP